MATPAAATAAPTTTALPLVPGVGTWMPVCSVSAFQGLGPTRVEIAGRKFAVWEHAGVWSVLSDACPHRLAPLSQGHVDPVTGCLECPYHGWQFSTSGACTKVPQSETGTCAGIKAGGMPTQVLGDILWAQLTGLGDALSSAAASPEELWPELAKLQSTTVRELPYSLEFLLENFMDPAHVPFAHHGLQGVRTDGSPIPMALLTSSSELVEVSFDDKIRGKPRSGIVSFRLPCVYHFRTRDSPSAEAAAVAEFKTRLIILTVPIRPGHSRAFVSVMGRPMPKWFPKWLAHCLSNRFLDTDVWLHDAERWARGTVSTRPFSAGKASPSRAPTDSASAEPIDVGANGLRGLPYALPTSADAGTRFFRQWWAQSGVAGCESFAPATAQQLRWEPRLDQFDRFNAHTATCSSCLGALRNFKLAKELSPLLALLPLALGLPLPARLLGLLSFGAVRALAAKAILALEGPQTPQQLTPRVMME